MRISLLVPLAAVFLVSGVFAQSQNSELDQLRSTVQSMQQTIDQMKVKIADLEKKTGQTNAPPQTRGTNSVTFADEIKINLPAVSPDIFPSQASETPDYHTLNEYQYSAPRPNNAPINTNLAGFMPLFGTRTAIKLSGFVRLDAINDFENDGNPNEFVTSSIPVDGQAGANGGQRFTIEAKSSRIDLELRRPIPGDDQHLRILYENDFYENAASPTMVYRLRQFYGQAYNLVIGQTYSTFMDIDAWPDTVDAEGPNSMISLLQQPQVRYIIPLTKLMHLSVSVEQPTSDINTTNLNFPPGSSPVSRAPDAVATFRWERKDLGHVQLGGIVRDLSYAAPNGTEPSVVGWGTSLSGGWNISKMDFISGQIAYGHGIEHYINDTGGLGLDAAIDASGQLKALPVFAPMIGYTHHWSDHWLSTASYGYVHVEAEKSQGPLALKETDYVSANLLWKPYKTVEVGAEYLYGFKRTEGGFDGHGNRIDFVVKYDLVH